MTQQRSSQFSAFSSLGVIHYDATRHPEKRKVGVDTLLPPLLQFAPVMGQQLRKRVKRQRRDARNKRVKERVRAGMKK
jgi:hypothetical protein